LPAEFDLGTVEHVQPGAAMAHCLPNLKRQQRMLMGGIISNQKDACRLAHVFH
jgi:hypothetical protein